MLRLYLDKILHRESACDGEERWRTVQLVRSFERDISWLQNRQSERRDHFEMRQPVTPFSRDGPKIHKDASLFQSLQIPLPFPPYSPSLSLALSHLSLLQDILWLKRWCIQRRIRGPSVEFGGTCWRTSISAIVSITTIIVVRYAYFATSWYRARSNVRSAPIFSSHHQQMPILSKLFYLNTTATWCFFPLVFVLLIVSAFAPTNIISTTYASPLLEAKSSILPSPVAMPLQIVLHLIRARCVKFALTTARKIILILWSRWSVQLNSKSFLPNQNGSDATNCRQHRHHRRLQ